MTPYSQAARPPIWHEPFGADLSKQSKQCVPPIHAGASFFCWMRLTHSALQAAETHTEAFSHVILKSLAITPIDGVSVVASCRTERLEVATNGAECREIPIEPFSPHETRRIVGLHDQTATDAEIAALQTRSGGNPRVLDALLRAGRPYDDIEPLRDETPSRADLLDGLLKQRIDDAVREALARGLSTNEIDALLAGLALLPLPVPLIELAVAHDRSEAAIESFAADLSPLIDRTPHGLIFRDEPTETLIRKLFKNDSASQTSVVERLERRQVDSSYAARALPIVLTSLGRTDDLIRLAFDKRVPNRQRVELLNARSACPVLSQRSWHAAQKGVQKGVRMT